MNPNNNNPHKRAASPTEFSDAPEEIDVNDFLTQINANSIVQTKTSKTAAKNTGHNTIYIDTLGTHESYKPFEDTLLIQMQNRNTQSMEYKGHAMVYMNDIDKFFCTHCFATIEPNHKDKHIKQCYIQKYPSNEVVHAASCQICVTKLTEENASAHYNSHGHSQRRSYITNLMKNTKFYYVAASGSSTVGESVTTVNIHFKISTEFWEARQNSAIRNESRYQDTQSVRFYKHLSQLLTNKKNGLDLVGLNLTQRNEVVKMISLTITMVSSGSELCMDHGSEYTDSQDFVKPSNLIDAVKTINEKLIENNKGFGEIERKSKLTTLDNFFRTTKTGARECVVCKSGHDIRKYENPRAIIQMLKALRSQL